MANKRQKKKRAKRPGTCPLCGKPLPHDPTQCVLGQTGQAVCTDCLQTAKRILAIPRASDQETFSKDIIPPSEIIRQLDKKIIGQDQAKHAVAVALWKQQLRAGGTQLPNSGLLLYGPTGCGKTALVREAAQIVGLPFLSFDATPLTEAGYRGRNASEMVSDLVDRCGQERAAHGVIFLDEVDKLAATKANDYRAAYSRGTQHSLLKVIEGTELQINGESFSTNGILFLFGGAFSGLYKELESKKQHAIIGFERSVPKEEPHELTAADFISYGMEAELMGRIHRFVPLQGLTASDFRRILLESELSSLRGYQDLFKAYGEELTLSDGKLDALIQKAVERGLGARGLNALVEEWIEPELFRLSEVGRT